MANTRLAAPLGSDLRLLVIRVVLLCMMVDHCTGARTLMEGAQWLSLGPELDLLGAKAEPNAVWAWPELAHP